MSLKDLLNKTKKYGTTMSPDILAYRLLKSANLEEHHAQLIRATIKELTFNEMQLQLKKIFGDNESNVAASIKSEVKVESDVYEVTDETDNEVYYQRNQSYNNRGYRGRFRGKKSFRGNGKFTPKRHHQNPLDAQGNISRCRICESINHWERDCPDQNSAKKRDSAEVTLFQSVLHSQESLKQFTGEALSAAILDSGASKTVCGKTWMTCYQDTLTELDKKKIKVEESSTHFKFGDGRKISSMKRLVIPARLGDINVNIATDVIDEDIPLLLSKDSMKKANTQIDFSNDTVVMFGMQQKIFATSSGHYAIALSQRASLNEISKNGENVTLIAKTVDFSDKKKVALKLHAQFSHPTANKLIKLISNAGLDNDKALKDNIVEVSENCKVCKVYKRAGAKPVVSIPLATEFNEVVAMDLKVFRSHTILHLIDHVTRFSAAAIVKSKEKEEIIKHIFRIWISIFGAPSKYL